jgi:hypothetical protein
MTHHIRALGQRVPDERGRLLRAEVHLVTGPSLHLVNWRDRRALCRWARAAVRLSSRTVAAGPTCRAQVSGVLYVLSPLPALPLSGRELCGDVRLHLLQQNLSLLRR